ncbi:nuclear transport factor 2 family protein [Nesterenkonia xinjiangensis]|uniref:SnoaL-like domain-containing protein n=1 Tax=Nesterenkonia xinjiangensis TaxID=225327 RepID=A0A7Z0GL22_9MICC|nr:nuclear transport factor 2 family protein [Nesterenkonia xinjiangensis]NYJ77984.1 hypothetical protein [Nesterenkonia xinjiangensis]
MEETSMQSAKPPILRQDPAGFVRWFIDRSFDGSEPVEDIWDSCHTPDAVHVMNQKPIARARRVKQLRQWRLRESPYVLQIRDAVVEGDRLAVRYAILSGVLWELRMETEHIEFHRLGDDGRISGSASVSRSGYIWGEPRDPMVEVEGAVADAPLNALPGTPGDDIATYLHEYNRLVSDESVAADDVFETFHTPGADVRINRTLKHRSDMVAAIRRARKKGLSHSVEVHDVLRQGRRFAARYTMTPERRRGGGPTLAVFDVGRLASDGRVCSLHTMMQSSSGAWPS